MVTLFLVFIITKGALTLYYGNTIGSGAVRGGDTAQTDDSSKEEIERRDREEKKRRPGNFRNQLLQVFIKIYVYMTYIHMMHSTYIFTSYRRY